MCNNQKGAVQYGVDAGCKGRLVYPPICSTLTCKLMYRLTGSIWLRSMRAVCWEDSRRQGYIQSVYSALRPPYRHRNDSPGSSHHEWVTRPSACPSIRPLKAGLSKRIAIRAESGLRSCNPLENRSFHNCSKVFQKAFGIPRHLGGHLFISSGSRLWRNRRRSALTTN